MGYLKCYVTIITLFHLGMTCVRCFSLQQKLERSSIIPDLKTATNCAKVCLTSLPFILLPFSPVLADTAVFSGGDRAILASKFKDLKYDPGTNDGVQSVKVGITRQPGSEDVQSVEIEYDSSKVSYKRLLGTYWRNIRPTQADGQFTDKGAAFRTIIWVTNEDEEKAALTSKRMIQESGIYDGPRDPVTFAPIENAGPELFTEVKSIKFGDFVPDINQSIDAEAVRKKTEKSGRAKYFKNIYEVRTFTDPKTKIGGYVTFPCSGQCIKALDGSYE
mmetsp:Transcript_25591/g.33482  ORF Transcript_25591/g.33482 Transcript_25591/m.33482 type:complete len:275 (+) Transcript_25591:135-959(+)